MHLKKSRRNGRIYLSIVQNYREGGTTKTKTIETIGYADTYADRFVDPIAHFEAYVQELNEKKRQGQAKIELSFPCNAEIEPDQTGSARWGSAIALAYLEALDIRSVFSARSRKHDIPAHTSRVFEMFASERVIHAAPKRETWERRASFPRPCNFSLTEAYEALQGIASCDRALAVRLRAAYESIRPCAPIETAYVVIGPFMFADTNDIDAEGTRGGSGGLSVGLAMVLDPDGIPAGYRLISPDPDAAEIARLTANVKRDIGAKRAVVIAGRLTDADRIMAQLCGAGDGFILHRALENAVDELQAWVVDQQGYTTSRSGNYRIKSRTSTLAIPCEDGARDATMREIVLWGRDYALQSRIKRPANGQEPAAELDGYACIATNELDLAAREVFHLYRELWRLVEPFQVLESDFSPSPYPMPRENHIRAHFAICYAAFFTMRLIRSDLHWRFNAAQVADALMRMEGSHLLENWFLFSYRSGITDAIEKAAGVDVARRLRTRQDIRQGIARARRHITGNESPDDEEVRDDAALDEESPAAVQDELPLR